MPRTPHDVTDAELAVLQALWQRGAATVRQLTLAIYPRATGSDNATVQKLLERLEAKRCVERDRDVWPYLFRATVDRQVLIERQLQSVAAKFCDGSLAPLAALLLQQLQRTPAGTQSLGELLDKLHADTNQKVLN